MAAKTYTVSTSEELYDSLALAKGGDTILLVAGEYGELKLGVKSDFDITFDSEVTIRSADGDAPATFSGLDLNGVANLTLQDVVFDYSYSPGDLRYTRYFEVNKSENVKILDSVFDGDVEQSDDPEWNGYGQTIGLSVRGTSGFTLSGSEMVQFHRGAVFDDASDLTITGNTIRDMSSDGFNFVDVQNAVIEGNSFSNFAKPEESIAHMDMIQFWTNGRTSPTTDIVIRGNHFDIAEGQPTHSIFMRNEAVDSQGGGFDMYYQNILIEENYIYNGHLHGITVGEADGLTIRDNTLVSVDAEDADYFQAPSIAVNAASENVVVTGNISRTIDGYDGQDGWLIDNNALVQHLDLNAAGHYREMFLASSITGTELSFIAKPGTEIDAKGLGAAVTTFDTAPAEITPLFDILTGEAANGYIFDASYTYGPAGQVTAEDAVFTWEFGDGTSATGRVIEHVFDAPGSYPVTLTVAAGGATYTADAVLKHAGRDVVSFDASTGHFLAEGYGESAALTDLDASDIVSIAGTYAIDLQPTGIAFEVPEQDIYRLFGAESYDVSMTVQADEPGSFGEVARVHNAFLFSIRQDGDVFLEAFSEAGTRFRLESEGLSLNDGEAHDIAMSFDSLAGTLQLLVDGSVVAETDALDGAAPLASSWGLSFGNPWGKANFDGLVTAVDINATAVLYPDYVGTEPPVASQDAQEVPAPGDSPVSPVEEAGVTTIAAIDDVIDLGQNGGAYRIEKSDLSEFFGADGFTLSMQVQADQPGRSFGEIARLHQSFVVTVGRDGDLTVTFFNDAVERTILRTRNLDINDGDLHAIELTFDGAADTLSLYVDGDLVAEATDVEGTTAEPGYWDLTFQNPWGRQMFDGQLSEFRIDVASDAGTEPVPSPEDAPSDDAVLTAPSAMQDVVSFDAEQGVFSLGSGGVFEADSGIDTLPGQTFGVDLGGEGAPVTVGRKAISDFFGAEAMDMSLTFQADEAGQSAGEILRIHYAFILSVDGDGDLRFEFFTDAGERMTVKTDGLQVNDGASHEIDIRFDARVDTLQIIVDGAVAAEQTGIQGNVADMGYWGLSFGNPWGKSDFDGVLTAFDLDVLPEGASEQAKASSPIDTDAALGSDTALPVVDDPTMLA